jgi:hypothetical protein
MTQIKICVTLPGRADVSEAAAGRCRLQLCAVLGSSGIKLSEYICTLQYLCVDPTSFDPDLVHLRGLTEM